jgi:hypothetical protein
MALSDRSFTPGVRDVILRLIAAPGADTRYGAPYFPASVQREAGCREHSVWEALWGLVADRLIYLDPDGQQSSGSQDNWRWKLSRVGMQAVSGRAWEPLDPEGYLRRLRTGNPPVAEVVYRYVEEALRAFNARCYLSSTVMLGVASERAVVDLATVSAEAYGPQAAKLARVLGAPRSSQQQLFVELRKVLEVQRENLPELLVDTLTLDAVGDLLRVSRNEAGHPTGVEVDADTARTHLLVAGGYLTKMTALRHHVESTGSAKFTS